jgi:hypothetical protein
MKAAPRPTITALPRSAASSMTARVIVASRSWVAEDVMWSKGSGGTVGSGELLARAAAIRCHSVGNRSS